MRESANNGIGMGSNEQEKSTGEKSQDFAKDGEPKTNDMLRQISFSGRFRPHD
jgi:hypothetical protein